MKKNQSNQLEYLKTDQFGISFISLKLKKLNRTEPNRAKLKKIKPNRN